MAQIMIQLYYINKSSFLLMLIYLGGQGAGCVPVWYSRLLLSAGHPALAEGGLRRPTLPGVQPLEEEEVKQGQ